MKIKFKSQPYQTAAVEAVVDCFEGQPNTAAQVYRIDPGVRAQMRADEDGFRNADLAMPMSTVLENIRKVQQRQNLPLSESLSTFVDDKGKPKKASSKKPVKIWKGARTGAARKSVKKAAAKAPASKAVSGGRKR